ncbi:hypothetical protein Tco_0436292 [Tanacetum coccineum]
MVERDDEIKVVRDDEIKVVGEVNVELESSKNLSHENESPDDFYGLMYDTDDDASISGKSCGHFSWDWDSPDQPIQLVVAQNNVHEGVAEDVIEMANDQAEALSSDKEVTDECLDDE